MDDKKQIEEMCKDFKCCVSCEMFGGYVDDEGKIVEGYCNDRSPEPCEKCGISTQQAKVLVNAGWRNCKDKVVMTMEEYEEMVADVDVSKEKLARIIDSVKAQGRKETVEKFISEVEFHGIASRDDSGTEWYKISELGLRDIARERFGVEVEE